MFLQDGCGGTDTFDDKINRGTFSTSESIPKGAYGLHCTKKIFSFITHTGGTKGLGAFISIPHMHISGKIY